MRTPAQEKLAAAVREYLAERDGGGSYADIVETTLPSGTEVNVLVRLELRPGPQWGD